MSKLEELSKAEPVARVNGRSDKYPTVQECGTTALRLDDRLFSTDPRPLVALLIQARDALKLLDYGTRFSEATETLAALAAFDKED